MKKKIKYSIASKSIQFLNKATKFRNESKFKTVRKKRNNFPEKKTRLEKHNSSEFNIRICVRNK